MTSTRHPSVAFQRTGTRKPASSRSPAFLRSETSESAMSPTQPAPAAVGIDPVLLHQEVLRPDLHVRSRAVRRGVGRAEVPRALVGVLVARIVVPGKIGRASC